MADGERSDKDHAPKKKIARRTMEQRRAFEEEILGLLTSGPATGKDLASTLGAAYFDVHDYLVRLLKRRKVTREKIGACWSWTSREYKRAQAKANVKETTLVALEKAGFKRKKAPLLPNPYYQDQDPIALALSTLLRAGYVANIELRGKR